MGREGDDEQSCSLIGSQGLRERGQRGLGKGLGTQHSLKGVPSDLFSPARSCLRKFLPSHQITPTAGVHTYNARGFVLHV